MSASETSAPETSAPSPTKQIIYGKTLHELESISSSLNLPSYSAIQIAEWLYKKRVNSFEEMTNLSKKTKHKLHNLYHFGLQKPSYVAVSSDGTRKYRFDAGNSSIETAWIPEKNRNTVCMSTQVGCSLRTTLNESS